MTIFSPKNPSEIIVSEKYQRNAPCQCGSGKKQKKCCGDTTKLYGRPTAKSIRIKEMEKAMAEIEAKKNNEESTVVMSAQEGQPYSEETIQKLKEALKKAKAEKAAKIKTSEKKCPTSENCINPKKCNELGSCLRCD